LISHGNRSPGGGVLPRLDPRPETARVRDQDPGAGRAGLCQTAGAFGRALLSGRAESGVKEDRRQLRRLLQDCRDGRVGSVIIPSLDRLSRDVRIAENLFHEFAQLGVDVLIADMPTYNAKNRKDIIERLWKGRQERVRRGLPPGGNVPYGYRRRAKRLIPEPAEAETVRSIFELAQRGETPSEIARILSAEGLSRRNGKTWTQRQVAAILARRSVYAEGMLRYGDIEGRAPKLVLLRERRS